MKQILIDPITVNKILRLLPNKQATHRKNVLHAYSNQTAKILATNDITNQQKKSAIICLVKGLSSGIQSDINNDCVTNKEQILDHYLNEAFPLNSYCPHCYTQFDTLNMTNLDMPVPLKSAPIISPVWNKERMTLAFTSIGTDIGSPFEHQKNNHFDLTYIKPLGLFWNGNGLHSVNTGILKGEGILYTSYVINLSKRYNHFEFDGSYYTHKKCNTPIFKPTDYRFGIIYEIGRILANNAINLW